MSSDLTPASDDEVEALNRQTRYTSGTRKKKAKKPRKTYTPEERKEARLVNARIIAQEGVIEQISETQWHVVSQTSGGFYYVIDKRGENMYDCDCEDWAHFRDFCKHTLSVQIKLSEIQ